MSVNLNPATATEFMTSLPIPWLNQNTVGSSNAAVLGYFFDLWNNEQLQAIQARFPGFNLSGKNLSPNDAIPYISDERGLLYDGYVNGGRDDEYNNNFRALLRLAWIYWKFAGTPLGILTQLYYQGYSDVDDNNITTMKLAQQNGNIYSLNNLPGPIDLLQIIDEFPEFQTVGPGQSVGLQVALEQYQNALVIDKAHYNPSITDPYDSTLLGNTADYLALGFDGYNMHPPWFTLDNDVDQNTGIYPNTNGAKNAQISLGSNDGYINVYNLNSATTTVSGSWSGEIGIRTTIDGYFNDYLNTASSSQTWENVATISSNGTYMLPFNSNVYQLIMFDASSISSGTANITLTGPLSYNIRDKVRQKNNNFTLLFTEPPLLWRNGIQYIHLDQVHVVEPAEYNPLTQYGIHPFMSTLLYDCVLYNDGYSVVYNQPPTYGIPPTDDRYWASIQIAPVPPLFHGDSTVDFCGPVVGIPNAVVNIQDNAQLHPSLSDINVIYTICNQMKSAHSVIDNIFVFYDTNVELHNYQSIGYPVQTIGQRNTYNSDTINNGSIVIKY